MPSIIRGKCGQDHTNTMAIHGFKFNGFNPNPEKPLIVIMGWDGAQEPLKLYALSLDTGSWKIHFPFKLEIHVEFTPGYIFLGSCREVTFLGSYSSGRHIYFEGFQF